MGGCLIGLRITSRLCEMACFKPALSLGVVSVAKEHMLTGLKRKREELELLKLEEEIKIMTQTRIIAATAEIERVRDPIRSNLDDRTRLMIQDAMQNSIMNNMIENETVANAPISISSVAVTLGYEPTSGDRKRIRMALMKRYRKQHGKSPPKHDQLRDGRVTSVNSYSEKDRALIVETLDSYFKPTDDSSSCAGDD